MVPTCQELMLCNIVMRFQTIYGDDLQLVSDDSPSCSTKALTKNGTAKMIRAKTWTLISSCYDL
jgi:hypothetical protein